MIIQKIQAILDDIKGVPRMSEKPKASDPRTNTMPRRNFKNPIFAPSEFLLILYHLVGGGKNEW